MNKKGQSLGLAIISGIAVLIIGMMFVNFITPELANFRIDMNCAAPDSISDGSKVMCLVADTTVIYWIVLVFSVVIGGITARLRI